ncbi:MAG: HTTM domain-containing protein [Planctomycetota bacterium]
MNQKIHDFLFSPTNPRAVAWFRLVFGVMLPWFFWSRGLHHSYDDPGLVWLYDNVVLTQAYYLAFVVLSCLFALGYKPRVTGLILFVLLLPMASLSRGRQSRQVILLCLFAFSLLRSGAVRFPWQSSKAGPELSAGPCWPVRVMQLQLTLLYLINALAKATPGYLSGEGLAAIAASHDNFKVDLTAGSLVLGPLAIPNYLLAISSVLTELFLALGWWLTKHRWLVAGVGVAFHISLMFIFDIWMLHVASIFLYLAFLLPLICRKRETSADPENLTA